jgi:UDPglucose 6-dehydrogenase
MDILKAVLDVNRRQRKKVIEKLQQTLKVIRGSTVGILGLAFKPNTDDFREAPAIDVIGELLDMGARVKVYDPVATDKYRENYPDQQIVYCVSAEDVARESDALVILTDWDQFRHLQWDEIGRSMQSKIIVDGRNMLSSEELSSYGFIYSGIGR